MEAADLRLNGSTTRAPDKRTIATRASLIVCAEQLIAQRGVESVSLREVSLAAKRNHTTAQYHFGTIAELAAAVAGDRMTEVFAQRGVILDGLTPEHRNDPRTIVRTMVEPLCDIVVKTDGWFARFLARCYLDPTVWGAISGRVDALPYHGSFHMCLDLLRRCVPDLPRPIWRSRSSQLAGLMVSTLAEWGDESRPTDHRLSIGELKSELVSTMVALALAPSAHA